MKCLYVAAECKPFSKAGGVGDVAGELPPALARLGIDIEIVVPLYGSTRLDGFEIQPVSEFDVQFNGQSEHVEILTTKLGEVPVLFVKNSTYFEGRNSAVYIDSRPIPYYDDVLRFSFLSEVCLQLIEDRQPDIVHINDWVLGVLFGRMELKGLTSKRVLTVHNISYQGNIGKHWIRDWTIESILQDARLGPLFADPNEAWDSVNPLRLALELAHRVTTVSPTYAWEITQPEDPGRFFEGGKGLHKITARLAESGCLVGILNGFCYDFDATEDRFATTCKNKLACKRELMKNFGTDGGALLGFVGRAVEQKLDLLKQQLDGRSVLEHILDIPDVNVAIVATGQSEYESFLSGFSGRSNYSATIKFDRTKAKQISLGADVFLMPSLYEPCGISQMESLSCATPPLVRWTGGLVDTVRPHSSEEGTGFGFDGESREQVLSNLVQVVRDAVTIMRDDAGVFQDIQRRGFDERFQWDVSASKYLYDVYEPLMSGA